MIICLWLKHVEILCNDEIWEVAGNPAILTNVCVYRHCVSDVSTWHG